MNEEIENKLYREGITIADTKKRALAFLIDEFLLSILFYIALSNSFSNAKSTEEIINLTNMFLLEYMSIKIIYQTFFVMQYGATVGKIIMKIRVIEIDTLRTPNVLVALNRGIFRVISELILYLGFLWGILDPFRQAWHDKTARTLVVDV